MMDTPEWITFLQWAGIITGALLPIALFFRAVRQWVGRLWRNLLGKSVTHRQLDSAVEKLRVQLVDKIEYHREHQASAHDESFAMVLDEIRELNSRMTEAIQGIADLKLTNGRVSIMESMLRLSADRDERVGTIYCDESGSVTFVSRALAQWMEASRADLMSWKWLSFTPAKDRAEIRAEFALARQEHREFRMPISMGPVAEPALPYMLTMTPMPDGPPAKAWAGYLTPLGHKPMDSATA